MNSTTNHFGLVVAYLLPGFIGLAGIAPFVPLVTTWLRSGAQSEAGLGPPVYAVLAATTIGMIASCVRWFLIDHIHQWTGISPIRWNDNRLAERISAFNYLVENHYRYYQFAANSLVAFVGAYTVNRLLGTYSLNVSTDIAALILCTVLFLTSRDALRKYHERTTNLLSC